MLKGWNRIAVVAMALLAAFLCKDILAGQATVDWVEERNPTNSPKQGDTGKPSKEEFIQKTQTLRMPFIANNGQMDEQVQFYAKTFGGTVFVTKDGEIVYSLPEGRGRDVPAGASHLSSAQGSRGAEEQGGGGAWWLGSRGTEGRWGKNGRQGAEDGWYGQAPLVRAESECAAYRYLPLFRTDNADCPPDRIFAKSLIAAYLPELQECTGKRGLSMPPNPHSAIQNPQFPLRGVALKERLVGGKINEIKGGAQSITTVSYFKGNDPLKWKSGISTYEVVDMGEVYKGIELKLKAYGNNVEKLFTVTPDANPEAIKLGLSGATALRVNEDGQLVAETELGPVKFTKPVAYQEIDGKRVEVVAEYRIRGSEIDGTEGGGAGEQGGRGEPETLNSQLETPNSKLIYGFTVASYDKTKPLIIDPLLASTYLGGSSIDKGIFLTLDTSGNVYVTGITTSTNFPMMSGAYDATSNGNYDVFVSKLNSGLTSLLASTYLGGSGDESGNSLTLDTSGNVYITGGTYSTNFPTTSGAYDTSHNGYGDVFVSKLNSGLTSLLASTYLGGSSEDWGISLTLDTSGNVYITGGAYSTNFPTTSGAYKIFPNGGPDVFVSKLNGGLTSLLVSTFLGGSSDDYASSLTLDISGSVYVTGYTDSADFPTKSDAYDTSHNGGWDVFVSKLNGGLASLLASTYLGGSSVDKGAFLTLGTGGTVYVVGYTGSTDFPTTSGAYDTSFNGGYWDVFVSKLNSGLTSLLASTYLGGSSHDASYSLILDTSGNVYITGGTYSTDFPTTSGAYDTSFNGPNDGRPYDYDGFVSKLDSKLTSLLASTFLGGFKQEEGYSLILDTSGSVYVTGWTESTDFPTTIGAYDTSYNGGSLYVGDAFVSKLDGNLSANVECTAESITASPNKLAIRKNGNGSVTITVTGAGECPVEGVTVTATIKGKGKRLVTVSPGSQETDANGQAVFAIDAKSKKGTAVIRFRANGLSRSATAQVKVR